MKESEESRFQKVQSHLRISTSLMHISVILLVLTPGQGQQMLSDPQRDNTRVVLKELFGLWDDRSSFYGNVLFCSAVARALDGKWRNVTSFFLPLHKEETFGGLADCAETSPMALEKKVSTFGSELQTDSQPNMK